MVDGKVRRVSWLQFKRKAEVVERKVRLVPRQAPAEERRGAREPMWQVQRAGGKARLVKAGQSKENDATFSKVKSYASNSSRITHPVIWLQSIPGM